MLLVDAIVKRTSLKMSDSASVLQEIVRAAADEKGEWHLPLTAQQRAAMQQVMHESCLLFHFCDCCCRAGHDRAFWVWIQLAATLKLSS